MPRGSPRPSSALPVLSGFVALLQAACRSSFSFGRIEIGEPPTFSLVSFAALIPTLGRPRNTLRNAAATRENE